MSINVDGREYALTDGDYDLKAMFKHNIVLAGQISEAVFNANVVSYYTDESFKGFATDAYTNGGDNAALLLLVAFGGPGAIGEVMQSARSNGMKGTKQAARRKRAWQSQLIEALVGHGHNAMSTYFNDNRDELMETCGVPVEDRRENYEDMLIATGRGTLSYKVRTWEGDGAANKDGKYAISLAYRLDANNKGRAKKPKASVNGVDTASPAPAK
tara:strand:- start:1076 stop:1717 length:642 start_codon:yes stop_codon:yes gene_type:complete